MDFFRKCEQICIAMGIGSLSEETLNEKLSVQYQRKVLKIIWTYELVYKKLVFASILFVKKAEFCNSRCSRKFCKIHRKTPVPEPFFNEVADWGQQNLPQVFSCELFETSKNTFLQNNSGQLLLKK